MTAEIPDSNEDKSTEEAVLQAASAVVSSKFEDAVKQSPHLREILDRVLNF